MKTQGKKFAKTLNVTLETWKAISKAATDREIPVGDLVAFVWERFAKTEQNTPCPLCGSTTYAGTIPSTVPAVSKSVPFSEQSLPSDVNNRSIEPLPPEAVEIAKAWLVARQVEDEEWRGMLESVTGQLELVANAARKEARKKESAWRGR